MKKNGKLIAGILAMIMMVVTLCSCSSGSGSGKKWSDLSDVEKNNARWAYEVQEAIKKQK